MSTPPLEPVTPNERSMLAKLRMIWRLAEADSQWAESAFNEEAAEEDAAMDSVQARMETVQAAVRTAAAALQRRSSTWGNENLHTPPTEEAVQLVRDGGRFSDEQSGLIFSSLTALIDYLVKTEPQEVTELITALRSYEDLDATTAPGHRMNTNLDDRAETNP